MECWANSEESNTKGKNKKKKKKSKTLKCENEHVRNTAIPECLLKCRHFKVVTKLFRILVVTNAVTGVMRIFCYLSIHVLESRSFLELVVAGGASSLLCSSACAILCTLNELTYYPPFSPGTHTHKYISLFSF